MGKPSRVRPAPGRQAHDPLRLPARRRLRVLLLADLSKPRAVSLARELRSRLRGHVEGLRVESARRLGPIRSRPDLVIVLGGDGAMLAASHRLGARQVPVMGVNFGSVGFLAAVAPERALGVLEGALRGDGECESHALMHVVARRGHRSLLDAHFLNDVVILRSWRASMAEVELRADSRPVCTYRGDGLIVATATGSTAYSLAAGGPVLSPRLDTCVVTPIAPYTLGMRPLVLPGHGHAELLLRSDASLTADGHTHRTLRAGDRVRVAPGNRRFRLVVDSEADFFARLRGKLRWGLLPGPG